MKYTLILLFCLFGVLSLVSCSVATLTRDVACAKRHDYVCQNGEPKEGSDCLFTYNRCASCDEGYTLVSNSCIIPYVCMDGTRASGDAGSEGINKCSSCNDDHYLEEHTCVDSCGDEYYVFDSFEDDNLFNYNVCQRNDGPCGVIINGNKGFDISLVTTTLCTYQFKGIDSKENCPAHPNDSFQLLEFLTSCREGEDWCQCTYG